MFRSGRGVPAGERVGARGAVPAVGRAVPRLPAGAGARRARRPARPARRPARARRLARGLPAHAAPALPQQPAGGLASQSGTPATFVHS